MHTFSVAQFRNRHHIQRMDKIVGTVLKEIHFLHVIQLISSLKQTHISSEQSLVEYYTTLHEEHLPVDSEVMEEGICFSP